MAFIVDHFGIVFSIRYIYIHDVQFLKFCFVCSQRAESHGPVEIISHWHPNLTINMVDDHTAWVKGSVPPPLDQRKCLLYF